MKRAGTYQFAVPGYMPMTEEERAQLWRDYRRASEQFHRNALVVEYMPIVKYMAETIGARLPNSVRVEDLVSYGTFGLISAIENFDVERGVKFETFCTPRVRGAIVDGLRSQDWVPRITRSRMRKFRAAKEQLELELGRQPTNEELAGRLGVDVPGLNDLLKEVSSVTIFSLSDSTGNTSDDSVLRNIDYIEDSSTTDPFEVLQKGEIMEVAKRCLSDREFTVIDWYYNREITMREIGNRFGMSESRVSQIHSKAIERLRWYLTRGERVSPGCAAAKPH